MDFKICQKCDKKLSISYNDIYCNIICSSENKLQQFHCIKINDRLLNRLREFEKQINNVSGEMELEPIEIKKEEKNRELIQELEFSKYCSYYYEQIILKEEKNI